MTNKEIDTVEDVFFSIYNQLRERLERQKELPNEAHTVSGKVQLRGESYVCFASIERIPPQLRQETP